MRPSIGTMVCCAFAAASAAYGQTNSIRCWWASDPNHPEYCTVNNWTGIVTISGPGTFKLDAVSAGGFGALGYINKIWIDPAQPVQGTVNVYIVRDPNFTGGNWHQPGATQVKEIDLTGATVGNLAELRCTNNVAANASIRVHNITDTCVVGGSILHDVVVDNAIQGPLTITGFLKANLTCGGLANLTVSGVGTPPATPPNITVGSGYGASMYVNQTVNTLTIGGDVTARAAIQIANYASLYNLAMPNGTLHGTLSVGDRLRSADLGGIAENAELSVAVQIGQNPTDIFRVRGDVAGRLSVPYVDANFQVDGAISSTGTVTVSQGLFTSFGAASIGSIQDGGTLETGTLDAQLSIGTLAGYLHAVDSQDGILQLTSMTATGRLDIGTLFGQVHAIQDLGGTLTAATIAPSGDVLADDGISAAVTVNGDMAGSVRTADGSDMSGALTIFNNLTGIVDIAGNLRDPGEGSDPEAPLIGHIVVNGSFYGTVEDPAKIQIGGELTGARPFIAVDYSGWTEGADWDPNTATVVLFAQNPGSEPLEITGNYPQYQIWHISSCRTDTNGGLAVDLEDADSFIEGLTDAQSYAHDYPGLGALQAPWDAGGSRAWHVDADCSATTDRLDLNAFMIRMYDPNGNYDPNDPNRCSPTCGPAPEPNIPTADPSVAGRDLLANVAFQRWAALQTLETELTDPNLVADADIRGYWTAVLGY